ncbi:MAG: dihydropteroate synthase [Cyanobacteriota bacterium]|nr:dihydropteroate synthase [Cyanobacteriota bacterium]
MGVINITPDSFSDGGRFLDPRAALAQARRLVAAGVELLDLGAQSTRPGAVTLSPEQEWARLQPILAAIVAARQAGELACSDAGARAVIGPLLSVDTFHAPVAAAALQAGADWINDVSGGRRDPAMLPLVAGAGCPYVLMHSRGDSLSMDAQTDYGSAGVVRGVATELLAATERALAAGIRAEQLIWDPGLGFAKTNEQNLELLRGLARLRREGFPLLVGPSRKRFIGTVLNEPRPRARIWGTAAVVAHCVAAGVAIVRVHDGRAMVQTVRMSEALRDGAQSGS